MLAHDTDDVDMLEGRADIVVIWDIRVQPVHRSKGIGHALFNGAIRWARERSCKYLRAETQNINMPACRFYQGQGCSLISIDRVGYPDFPNEIKLIWEVEC